MGAGLVAALGVNMRQLLHNELRRVWLNLYLRNVRFDFISESHVRRVVEIVLIQDDDSESLGMSSQGNHRLQCIDKLEISI